MKNYSLEERATFYAEVFPKYPKVVVDKNWLYGVWVIGSNYKSTGYYGAYPPGYLKRLHALFPDAENVLHLFSGTTPREGFWKNVTMFDSNEDLKPDIVGDAHKLLTYFNIKFDLILADPPYSDSDAKHYGTIMIKRKNVFRQACQLLTDDGYLCWLDQVLPPYRKIDVKYVGTIGMVRSTNHRFRILSIFAKSNEPKDELIITKKKLEIEPVPLSEF